MAKTYSYNQQLDLSASELFVWITVDKTLERLGATDVDAVFAIVVGQPIISTRAKIGGAIKGTSIASIAGRRLLNYDLKYRLPMITGASIRTLRISLTRNLGAFVGRAVPVVGWIVLANDVAHIMWNAVSTCNAMVVPEDRLLA